MDWYPIVKFLHVVAALLWVGGGFTLIMLGARADRAGDTEGLLRTMRAIADLGNRLFMPSSLATLLLGLVMCWFWVGFGDLWIVIGLAGYLVTLLVGVLVFKPTADRLMTMIAADGPTPAAIAQARRIVRVARFDYSVMAVVIADMVLKPTIADTAVLAAMGMIVLAGAAFAFGGFGQREEAAA